MPRSRTLALIVSRLDLLDQALALATAARARDLEVAAFFMSDAVAGLPARRAALAALADDHALLICCGTSATEHRLDQAAVGMPIGSQDDHAAMVDGARWMLGFT